MSEGARAWHSFKHCLVQFEGVIEGALANAGEEKGRGANIVRTISDLTLVSAVASTGLARDGGGDANVAIRRELMRKVATRRGGGGEGGNNAVGLKLSPDGSIQNRQ